MLADARANKGIVPYYGDLTPVHQRHETPPPTLVQPKKPRPKRAATSRTKPRDVPLTDVAKARLRKVAE